MSERKGLTRKAAHARPRRLCNQATLDGPCWRLADHNGRHVNQRYMVEPSRPLAVVAPDGVLVALYRMDQLAAAEDYIKSSGGHAVDVHAWAVKA